MKNLLIKLLGVGLVAHLAISTAVADTVNQRQYQQLQRIVQGIKSGELTAPEAYRLTKQQASIAVMERRFKSDGHLSANERFTLRQRQHRASAAIYRGKHNAADRN